MSQGQYQTEALELSGEILRNIECREAGLTAICLKTSRLARLMNDPETQQMFTLEAGGYATGGRALPPDRYRLAIRAGRRTTGWDTTGHLNNDMVWTESIDELDSDAKALALRLESAPEVPGTQIGGSSMVIPSHRQNIQAALTTARGRMASRRQLMYEYALAIHYELKYAGIATSVFDRLRNKVDAAIARTVPGAVQKFSSVYDNLASANAEDWANAVHSCRRLLQDFADELSPPTDQLRVIREGGKDITVSYGPDQYINRLIKYVEDHSASSRFESVVGTHLKFLGDRLDAVFRAAQKGSHATVTKDEAERYVVYTYLLLGDVLSLEERPS